MVRCVEASNLTWQPGKKQVRGQHKTSKLLLMAYACEEMEAEDPWQGHHKCTLLYTKREKMQLDVEVSPPIAD